VPRSGIRRCLGFTRPAETLRRCSRSHVDILCLSHQPVRGPFRSSTKPCFFSLLLLDACQPILKVRALSPNSDASALYFPTSTSRAPINQDRIILPMLFSKYLCGMIYTHWVVLSCRSSLKLIPSILVIGPQYGQTACLGRRARALPALVLKPCAPKPAAPVVSCPLSAPPLQCFGRHLETSFYILVNNIIDFISLYIACSLYEWLLWVYTVFLTENHVWRGTEGVAGHISKAK